MKKLLLLTLLGATLALIASSASAATMSASLDAPAINSEDIANYGTVTGTDKWFAENSGAGAAKGQTFTTGDTEVILKAITYQVSATQKAEPTKTYVIRVGTVAASTFTEVHNESATQDFTWNNAEYMTWTFDSPVLLAPNTVYGIDVGMTASTSGWTTGIPYINMTGNSYNGGVRYTSGTSGVGTDTLGLDSGKDRIFHLDIENPMSPTPEDGAIVQGGQVDLSWTNIDPNDGYPVIVDVWYGSDPDPKNGIKVVDGVEDANSVTVTANDTGVYYWQVILYYGGTTTGDSYESDVFSFEIIDFDGDGFPDDYEMQYTDPPSPTALNAEDDLDDDGLTNMEEYLLGTIPINPDTDGDTLKDGPELLGVGDRPATDPLLADTDGDGINDGVETNTGVYVDATDTGTNPALTDTDRDGLTDGVETNTGIFVDATDTGTDPLDADSDGDDAEDWYEVAASYTNPTDADDNPGVPYPLPISDPCDVPAGYATKPVKVYILAGQSNMVGYGSVTGDGPGTLNTMVNTENKFPNLVDETGAWIARNDVMYRGVVTCIGNGPLTPTAGGSRYGPEYGFGQVMGYYHDAPVLLIKSSQGNRSISWDYAPPSTPRFIDGDYTYAAYGESPNRWLTSESPTPFVWYCGKQWDDCFMAESDMGAPAWADATDYPKNCQVTNNGQIYISTTEHTSSAASEPGVGAESSTNWNVFSIFNAADVLDNFAAEYPQFAAQGFEIAGYVWWQGHKDGGQSGTGAANIHATRYELNMVNFIEDIRDYYEGRYPDNIVPDAPFVVASVGFDGGAWEVGSSADVIHTAQMAVGDPDKHPEFAGNVASVDTVGYWRDGSISPTNTGYHYNHNAETFLLTGDALGRAMMELESAHVGAAGTDMVTWSGEPVTLTPVVEDGVTVESYSWSATPADGVVFDSNSIENPTVTITKSAGDAAAVTIDLTINVQGGSVITDSMTIEVYDTACQAAIGAGLQDENPGDVNADCVTDIEDLRLLAEAWLTDSDLSDLADMAATWLADYTLTGPAAK